MENTIKNMWNTLTTIMFVLLAVIGIVCPDIFPGPIDDAIVGVMAFRSIIK